MAELKLLIKILMCAASFVLAYIGHKNGEWWPILGQVLLLLAVIALS